MGEGVTLGHWSLTISLLLVNAEPRTKTWKVTVPGRLKDSMEDSAMYPAGWSHRTFSFRPEQQRHTGAPAGATPPGARPSSPSGGTPGGGELLAASAAAGTGTTSAAGTGTTSVDGTGTNREAGARQADTVVTLDAGAGATPAAFPLSGHRGWGLRPNQPQGMGGNSNIHELQYDRCRHSQVSMAP